jgi:hypothetical protein
LTGVKYCITHTYFGIAEWSERSGDATTALVRRLQESDMDATVTAGQAHGHVYRSPAWMAPMALRHRSQGSAACREVTALSSTPGEAAVWTVMNGY